MGWPETADTCCAFTAELRGRYSFYYVASFGFFLPAAPTTQNISLWGPGPEVLNHAPKATELASVWAVFLRRSACLSRWLLPPAPQLPCLNESLPPSQD